MGMVWVRHADSLDALYLQLVGELVLRRSEVVQLTGFLQYLAVHGRVFFKVGPPKWLVCVLASFEATKNGPPKKARLLVLRPRQVHAVPAVGQADVPGSPARGTHGKAGSLQGGKGAGKSTARPEASVGSGPGVRYYVSYVQERAELASGLFKEASPLLFPCVAEFL